MNRRAKLRSAVLLVGLLATIGGAKVAVALARNVPNHASPEMQESFPDLF